MKPRNVVFVALAVSLLLGCGGLALSGSNSSSASAEDVDSTQTLVTATVKQGDLSDSEEFKAKVSFGDSFDAPISVAGTITYQRPIGDIVRFSESLIRVDEAPVFLAEGKMPLYRELYKVDTRRRDENGDRLTLLEGKDVSQLQQFLIEAGFDADEQMQVDGIFGKSTEKAVKAWQESVGLSVTGRITAAQLMFSPERLRIDSESRIGAPYTSLSLSAAEATVTIDTNNRDRSALPVDSTVTVELPDGTVLEASVASQKQVALDDRSSIWRTTLNVKGELPGDASSATVTATITLASDVLYVPVGALLALAEGGFAVEVSNNGVAALVAVEVGEVLDGQAEISGNLAEGDQVVVPV